MTDLKKCSRCGCKLRGDGEYCCRCEYELNWLSTPENFCYCGKLIPAGQKRCEACEATDDARRLYYHNNRRKMAEYHRNYMAEKKKKENGACKVCGNNLTKNGFCRRCHAAGGCQKKQEANK
jgi:hypothetical protein